MTKYTLCGLHRQPDNLNTLSDSFLPRGEGLPYKRTVELVVPFRVKKAVLVPLRVLSLKRSAVVAFAVPFRVLSRKKYYRKCYLFSRRGDKNLSPPQDRFLVPLRGSFQNIRRATPSILFGSSHRVFCQCLTLIETENG